MRYSYLPLKFGGFNSVMPRSKSANFPVARVASSLTLAELDEQVKLLEASWTSVTPLSATGAIGLNGTISLGGYSNIRNSYDLGIKNITSRASQELLGAGALTWNQFSFSSNEFTPYSRQALGYKQGGFFVPHYDDSCYTDGTIYRNEPNRALVTLLYLNDNYTGGELVFPNIVDSATRASLTIKPKEGEIIAFPPHELYSHYIKPVLTGTRLVLSQWFSEPYWFRDFGTIRDPAAIALVQKISQANTFTWGHQAIVGTNTTRFLSRNYVDTKDYKTLSLDLTDQLPSELAVLWKLLSRSVSFGHSLQRCYLNGQTYGLNPESHTDTAENNSYTTIIYCNSNWNRDWGGATVFYFSPTNSKLIEVSPYRIIQFSGKLPHQALPLTAKCNELRKTLIFKSRRINELAPKDRPISDSFKC